MRPNLAPLLLLLLLSSLPGCGRQHGNHEPASSGQVAPATGEAPSGDESEQSQGEKISSAEQLQHEQPDSAVFTLIPDLDYNTREGRKLYRYYCLPCHGEEGGGDGFNAYNLDPRPRDLSDVKFQLDRTDDDLAAIIRSGGGAAGLSTGMPPWGRTLSQRQRANLVLYLRILAARPPEKDQGLSLESDRGGR